MEQLSDAFIIIDLQNGVCHAEGKQIDHLEELVVAVNKRIAFYHTAELPIIFVQHQDATLRKNSFDWEILSGIQIGMKSHFVNKTHANSFYQTDLSRILTKNNVKSLEICGAQTEYCIDATIKFAHGMGYDLRMQKNMSTTYDNEFMTATQNITFYEKIWDGRFLTFI
ncbi:cysteine hydrolase family protein [Enterococcus dispar]|uniref:Isochorismatase-like domain-containing protein n=1 Tax=Enterococcus dispar ATCC 51266 TaxID=1139219 RepID=S1NBP4_9ENTE|nr:cysteine hydrolase family protein [Enterococcus dispar]EOT40242.1 hypothetical protein OMK_02094 [Enterococcus dispar ATCC 51266]EOW86475.1 hypothetical protein I569_01810 [Enterococcus dispar ATCC 51266]OJG39563.1 hypothetical protein RV01_GL001510 [Enterococcus dispar]